MCHSTGGIAVLLVEYSRFEHQVVYGKKKDRPFQKRDIQPFDALLHKCCLIVKIFQGEEISCRNEEQRHVKLIQKTAQRTGTVGMADNHQYDAECFANGYGLVSFHSDIDCFVLIMIIGKE